MSLVFVDRREVAYRFGFVGDAKDIERHRARGVAIPKVFRPAVRRPDGEIVVGKSFERYHAEIVARVDDPRAVEGYAYAPESPK